LKLSHRQTRWRLTTIQRVSISHNLTTHIPVLHEILAHPNNDESLHLVHTQHWERTIWECLDLTPYDHIWSHFVPNLSSLCQHFHQNNWHKSLRFLPWGMHCKWSFQHGPYFLLFTWEHPCAYIYSKSSFLFHGYILLKNN